jgi:hypothetical protein
MLKYLLVIILFIPVFTFAHSEGNSLEAVSNEYLIDVGYDAEELIAGQAILFDFNLLDKTGKEFIDYTNIWVKIEKDTETFLSTNIHRSRFGLPGLTYIFSAPGEYTLNVRFQNENESLAENTFTLSVEGPVESNQKNNLLNTILFLISGLVIGFVFFKFYPWVK